MELNKRKYTLIARLFNSGALAGYRMLNIEDNSTLEMSTPELKRMLEKEAWLITNAELVNSELIGTQGNLNRLAPLTNGAIDPYKYYGVNIKDLFDVNIEEITTSASSYVIVHKDEDDNYTVSDYNGSVSIKPESELSDLAISNRIANGQAGERRSGEFCLVSLGKSLESDDVLFKRNRLMVTLGARGIDPKTLSNYKYELGMIAKVDALITSRRDTSELDYSCIDGLVKIPLTYEMVEKLKLKDTGAGINCNGEDMTTLIKLAAYKPADTRLLKLIADGDAILNSIDITSEITAYHNTVRAYRVSMKSNSKTDINSGSVKLKLFTDGEHLIYLGSSLVDCAELINKALPQNKKYPLAELLKSGDDTGEDGGNGRIGGMAIPKVIIKYIPAIKKEQNMRVKQSCRVIRGFEPKDMDVSIDRKTGIITKFAGDHKNIVGGVYPANESARALSIPMGLIDTIEHELDVILTLNENCNIPKESYRAKRSLEFMIGKACVKLKSSDEIPNQAAKAVLNVCWAEALNINTWKGKEGLLSQKNRVVHSTDDPNLKIVDYSVKSDWRKKRDTPEFCIALVEGGKVIRAATSKIRVADMLNRCINVYKGRNAEDAKLNIENLGALTRVKWYSDKMIELRGNEMASISMSIATGDVWLTARWASNYPGDRGGEFIPLVRFISREAALTWSRWMLNESGENHEMIKNIRSHSSNPDVISNNSIMNVVKSIATGDTHSMARASDLFLITLRNKELDESYNKESK